MGKKKRKKSSHRFKESDASVGSRAASPKPFSFPWKTLLFLFFVGISVYFNSFFNAFIWDDNTIILKNEYIRSFSKLPVIFISNLHEFSYGESNFYRPLQSLSYMINYAIGGYNPFGYHLLNAVIHIFNSFLVFLLLNSIFVRKFDVLQQKAQFVSLSTALVWLIHPIHTQCTTYVSGRADLMVAFFILGSLLALHLRKSTVVIIMFILALLSKEYGVMTPVMWILYIVLTKEKWKGYKGVFATGVFILAVYVALRLTVLNFPMDQSQEISVAFVSRLLTSAKAICILIGLIVFPASLSMVRNIPWEVTLFKWDVFLSVVFVCFLVACLFFTYKKNRLVCFGLAWFFVSFAPFFNIIPLNANVSEHWMYLPSVGIILSVMVCWYDLLFHRSQKLYFMGLLVMVLILSVVLFRRNADFKNEIVFYNKELLSNPKNSRLHYNLGTAYGFAGENDRAIDHLKQSIEYKKDYAAAYANLGQLYFRQDDTHKAIEYYKLANQYSALLTENKVNLGAAYTKIGKYDLAMEQFQAALELKPNHTGALNGLGVEYGRKGKLDVAQQYFLKALQIDPQYDPALNNLKKVKKMKALQR